MADLDPPEDSTIKEISYDCCSPDVCKFLTDFDYYLITRRTAKKEDIQGFDLFPGIEQQDALGFNVVESTHLYLSSNLKS